MQTFVFLDLDDTLFQTRPKCPPEEPLFPAASNRDGQPLSFMTRRQQALLEMLCATATVIPTTARNLDAFRRVHVPFAHRAILDFGAVVLHPDGTPDPTWDGMIRPQTERVAAELHAILNAAQQWIDIHRLGVNARLISDFDMPLYLVLKHPHGDGESLRIIQNDHWGSLDRERFFVHRNGNNLSLVPRFLGKERAVRYVIEWLLGPEPILTIGVGDSFSDAPFLAECDYALMPRGSQLAVNTLTFHEAR